MNTQPDNAAVGVELDILAICLSPGKGIVLKNSSDRSKLEMFAICPSPGKGIVLNKSSDTSNQKINLQHRSSPLHSYFVPEVLIFY